MSKHESDKKADEKKESITALFAAAKLMKMSMKVLMVCVGSAGMTR
jgi:hypothetical protein